VGAKGASFLASLYNIVSGAGINYYTSQYYTELWSTVSLPSPQAIQAGNALTYATGDSNYSSGASPAISVLAKKAEFE